MNAASFSVLAALSLGAAHAQTGSAPNGPSTSVARPTANPELDGASTAQRHSGAREAAASAKIATGMQVRSRSGELLGNVASIVPAGRGSDEDGYVVVASSNGIATPLPYSAARSMVQNGTLVVDESRFQNAPKVQQYQSEDSPHRAWEQKADSYWRKYAMSSDQNSGVRR
jgi:hypothetical protein